MTPEDFRTKVLKFHPDIELLEEYKNLKEPIKVLCNTCGKIWSPHAVNLLYGSGCPNCAVEKSASQRRKSHNQFEKEIQQILPTVKVIGTYKNLDTPVECECLVCGFIWDPLPQSLLNGHGCKRCSRSGTSFMEQFILHAFIEALGEGKVKSRDRTAVGMELDVYIPSCKLAIEPGTWAFHKNSRERDIEKRKLCKKRGIRLITVYDSFSLDEKIPFEDDCIVFEKDYNIADHIYIRNLVKDLFGLADISLSFTDEQWIEIEKRAYRDARAKNTKDFVEELEAIRSDVEILGTYVGSKIPINTRCKKCGCVWKPRPANLLHGSGCPACSKVENAKRQTKSHDQFVDELKKIQPSIIILGRYLKGKAHIDAECNICGTKWNPIAASLLDGEGCPKCGLIKKANGRRKTQDQYKAELFAVNPDIKVIGTYTGTTNPIRVRCKICGYEWERVARKLMENPHHKYEKKMHDK